MTPNHLTRFTQAFALALIVAALGLTPIALGNTSTRKPAPDWFERYAAAHSFGHGSLESAAPAPDWFERYAATHPFGHPAQDSNRNTGPRLMVARLQTLLVDDWFRDASALASTHRPIANRPTAGFIVDDWFRDSSGQARKPLTAAKRATRLLVDDWFRDPR